MSTEIQPLHQRDTNTSFLQKKLSHSNDKSLFASPTDELLSPCTEKLKNHKSRFFAKSKPTKLNFSNLTNYTKSENTRPQFVAEGKEEEDILTKKQDKKELEFKDEEIMQDISLNDI